MWLDLDWFQRSLNCHQTKIDRNSPMCSLHSALRFVGFVVQIASIQGRINIHFLPGLVPELRKLSPDENWSKLTYVQPTFCTEVHWFRCPKQLESSIRGRINIHFLPDLVPELRKLSPDENWSKRTYVQPTFCTEVRWFHCPKWMESSIRGRINIPFSCLSSRAHKTVTKRKLIKTHLYAAYILHWVSLVSLSEMNGIKYPRKD